MKNTLPAQLFQSLIVVLVAWLVISTITFGFRHPWATDTERLLHIGDALMFKKIPYNEMRPREQFN